MRSFLSICGRVPPESAQGATSLSTSSATVRRAIGVTIRTTGKATSRGGQPDAGPQSDECRDAPGGRAGRDAGDELRHQAQENEVEERRGELLGRLDRVDRGFDRRWPQSCRNTVPCAKAQARRAVGERSFCAGPIRCCAGVQEERRRGPVTLADRHRGCKVWLGHAAAIRARIKDPSRTSVAFRIQTIGKSRSCVTQGCSTIASTKARASAKIKQNQQVAGVLQLWGGLPSPAPRRRG